MLFPDLKAAEQRMRELGRLPNGQWRVEVAALVEQLGREAGLNDIQAVHARLLRTSGAGDAKATWREQFNSEGVGKFDLAKVDVPDGDRALGMGLRRYAHANYFLIWYLDEFTCQYCDRAPRLCFSPAEYTHLQGDHILPFRRGDGIKSVGEYLRCYHWTNYALAHFGSCNQKKWKHEPPEGEVVRDVTNLAGRRRNINAVRRMLGTNADSAGQVGVDAGNSRNIGAVGVGLLAGAAAVVGKAVQAIAESEVVKAQFLDVIQYLDDSKNTLAWRFPFHGHAIQSGGRLVVREGQAAVFIAEGRLSDVFGPGTYELSTRTKPIWGFFESIKYGLDMPYKGDVYFFSTNQFVAQKWTIQNPLMMRDADLGVVRVRAFGSFAFRITDPAVFLREIVSTSGLTTTEEITKQLKAKLVSCLADTLGEEKIPVFDLVSKYMDLGDALRQRLTGWFQSNYGITLTDFVIENVSVPPEVEAMIDKRSQMALMGDMHTYTQFQAANAMVSAAKRPGGRSSDALNAGIGLAVGQALFGRTAVGPAGESAGSPPVPPPLPAVCTYHYAGPDNQKVVLSPPEIATRVRAAPNARHLVWKDGMGSVWTAAVDVPEIAALLRSTPPPLPSR